MVPVFVVVAVVPLVRRAKDREPIIHIGYLLRTKLKPKPKAGEPSPRAMPRKHTQSHPNNNFRSTREPEKGGTLESTPEAKPAGRARTRRPNRKREGGVPRPGGGGKGLPEGDAGGREHRHRCRAGKGFGMYVWLASVRAKFACRPAASRIPSNPEVLIVTIFSLTKEAFLHILPT